MANAVDMSPTKDILSFAVRELTKEWPVEKQQEFSKYCFDVVCTQRYLEMKAAPKMDLNIITR